MKMSLSRRVATEFFGTAFLLAVIVGSGIMGERLSGGNTAIALLANSLATGCGLYVLISVLGPISGAHFNPVVTLSETLLERMPRTDAAFYVVGQFVGAYVGVATANLMFELPAFFLSQHPRQGKAQLFSEFVATFALVAVIQLCSRLQPRTVAIAVAAYITAAYWFTASTSFANPAVTLGRSASDTFAGIRLVDVPGFVVAQLLGASAATALCFHLFPASKSAVDDTRPVNP